MMREVSSLTLTVGGNIVRQGEHFLLGYQPKDVEGNPVNLEGKTLSVAFVKRNQVVYETTAEFDPGDGLLYAHVDQNIGSGEMWLEFTATDPNAPTYRKKFPSSRERAIINVVPGADDIDFVGVGGTTVEQLRTEQATAQQEFESVIVPKVETIETQQAQLAADYQAAAGALTEDSEVILARGDKPTLGARLDETAVKLDNKADEVETFQQLVPKNYVFGEQLANMKYALSNPLEQFMSIVMIGDSITWGLGATGNPADYDTGRDGTLSDIRDSFASASWVNLLKRHIGANYMRNAAPALSNWAASPAGESIVSYSREIRLYPYGGDFKLVSTGDGATVLERALSSSLMGRQLVLNAESAKAANHTVSFTFTGKEITLSYDSVEASMNYEFFIDGVSKGIFSTAPGIDGNIAGSDNRRTHTFDYVKDALIEIKSSKTSYVGVQTLRLAGVIVNKTIRISNQGIIGIKAANYASRALDGNTNGDGVAVSAEDNYVFIQLGTNDRIISTDYAKGVNAFKYNMQKLLNILKTEKRQIVLMSASPTANESTSSFSFTMQDVRNSVYQIAKENSIDMIDNFLIFGDMQNVLYTIDYLHLNDYGNKIVARNIINSLESSAVASNQSDQLDLGTASMEDYSSGVWTPVVKGSVTEGAHTYNANTGSYVKIGKLVIAQFYISINVKDTAASGDVRIYGLPFTASTGTIQPIDFAVVTMESGKTGVVANLTTNLAYALLQQIGNGTGRNPMPTTALANASSFSGTLTYVTSV